jgi:hypothetical protein
MLFGGFSTKPIAHVPSALFILALVTGDFNNSVKTFWRAC